MILLLLQAVCLLSSTTLGSLTRGKGEAAETSWLSDRAPSPARILESNQSLPLTRLGAPDMIVPTASPLSLQMKTHRPHPIDVATQSSQPTVDSSLSWGGTAATSDELDKISSLRQRLSKVDSTGMSVWIKRCLDVEILRFLRHHGGRVDDTFTALVEHAKWRITR